MLSQECYALFFQGGLKKNHGTVVVHPTAYDGCVELAALQLGHPVCGSSLMDASYKCAKEIVKNHLLQASLKHPKVLISVVLQQTVTYKCMCVFRSFAPAPGRNSKNRT